MLEYTDPEEMSLELRGVVETMFWSHRLPLKSSWNPSGEDA